MTAPAGPVRIRRARPDDAAALAAMFGRCSDRTRRRRFHGLVTELPAAYLRRCLEDGPGAHAAFVAEPAGSPGGPILGLASAGPVPGNARIREAGALVEDARQRQGIGRRLLTALSADARVTGVEVLRLELCRSQPSLLAYVLARARVVAVAGAGCDATVEVAVPFPGDPGRPAHGA